MTEYLKEKVDCLIIDAEEICRPFHSSRYFNAVILGAAAGSGRLGLAAEALLDAIGAGVREEYVTTNKQAFMAGLEAGKKYAAE
jgi:indolepyruvate ferredoxin oxidoreductase beta subunit